MNKGNSSQVKSLQFQNVSDDILDRVEIKSITYFDKEGNFVKMYKDQEALKHLINEKKNESTFNLKSIPVEEGDVRVVESFLNNGHEVNVDSSGTLTVNLAKSAGIMVIANIATKKTVWNFVINLFGTAIDSILGKSDTVSVDTANINVIGNKSAQVYQKSKGGWFEWYWANKQDTYVTFFSAYTDKDTGKTDSDYKAFLNSDNYPPIYIKKSKNYDDTNHLADTALYNKKHNILYGPNSYESFNDSDAINKNNSSNWSRATGIY
ncbi:hypothetical protein [Paramaledivibacter caminithermalis]|jgi:hypothetical protein|uniref:Uncharacterized protein n=1 Tax=Paramaledivibacter caminithermalis (strain DSM 15212 / CIP 107654 / DViRD3) TaxID=1121301 RepID=A0A1M6PRJ7_PARC5|nr:hypothetical protein [Paramaledivibacter caminithermalis]SHK10570.1 hypothetical protein SAMN02745912_02261 [Paramaledivibacter caminithermalis DSM 15212]